jgi:hypothetical protein
MIPNIASPIWKQEQIVMGQWHRNTTAVAAAFTVFILLIFIVCATVMHDSATHA